MGGSNSFLRFLFSSGGRGENKAGPSQLTGALHFCAKYPDLRRHFFFFFGLFCFFSFVPEMASSIFLRAPKVVMPSSFRSWSVRVRNVCRSIWKQR